MAQQITREQYLATKPKWIMGKKDCHFCEINEDINKILHRTQYWTIMENFAPYSWNHQHIMAMPKSHKAYAYEFSLEEFQDLQNVHKFVKEFYGNESYFSMTRETLSNRSVEHYHMHFLPGKLSDTPIINMLKDQGFPVD